MIVKKPDLRSGTTPPIPHGHMPQAWSPNEPSLKFASIFLVRKFRFRKVGMMLVA